MPQQLAQILAESMRLSRTPHAVFDGDSGLLVSANDAFARIVSEHQIISFRNLLTDYPEIQSQIQRCRTDRTPQSLAHEASSLDLEFLPLLDTQGALLGVQLFATPQSHEATAAQCSQLDRRFQTALEKFPLNAWMCSQEGEMFWRNHTGNRFSHNVDVVHDTSNTYWISKFHPDDLPTANQTFAKAMMDGVVRPFRYRMQNGDGDYQWHLSNYAPVRNDREEIDFWVGTGINIQSFVETEERLQAEIDTLKTSHDKDRRLLREANDLLAKTQKMELITHLAGGVAHDLNNLLFIMSLNTDLLFKQLPAGALKESASSVRDQIKKAARLSSQLMGFSGRKPQSMSAVDPRSLLDEIGDLLHKAVGAETHFNVLVDDDVEHVHVDKMYLENSLINLAINARDAVAGKGSIELSISNTHLKRGGQPEGFVVFRMRDDGSGMAPEVLDRIYEPFFTTKSPNQGTGLGIPMVRNFVESSGGFMEVESAPGVGTVVSLYLPKSTQALVEVRVEESSTPPQTTASLLIIDDDASVRDALTVALNGVGYQNIATACNSEYAIQFLSQGMAVDLIISDIRMPGKMDISHFLRKLEEMHLHIPVIFATGYSEDVVIEQSMVEGKHPVLFKPFTLEDLFAKIRETMPEHHH